jgi:hypothetical protein
MRVLKSGLLQMSETLKEALSAPPEQRCRIGAADLQDRYRNGGPALKIQVRVMRRRIDAGDAVGQQRPE